MIYSYVAWPSKEKFQSIAADKDQPMVIRALAYFMYWRMPDEIERVLEKAKLAGHRLLLSRDYRYPPDDLSELEVDDSNEYGIQASVTDATRGLKQDKLDREAEGSVAAQHLVYSAT